ncbi:MAG: hypothetical protein OEM24_12265, partial [Paracoccaceae bacterium]|nr:hypothetical protein [Paracoccaceae bacterium]
LHASVWDARAEQLLQSGRGEAVAITVVPVDGAPLTPELADTIAGYVAERCLPGVRLEIRPFRALNVAIDAMLRVDRTQFVAEDVADAARAALLDALGLGARRLAQPMFIAEVLGVLETVPGAETATATLSVSAATPTTAGQEFRSLGGALRALYPDPDQVAFLAGPADISVRTEDL